MAISINGDLSGKFWGTKEECGVFLDYAKKNKAQCSEIHENTTFMEGVQNNISRKMPHVQIGRGKKKWVHIDKYAIEVTFPNEKVAALALLKF